MDEEDLSYYQQRSIVRIGAHMHRPAGWWTPAVHGLLNHLEAVGFAYSPRVIGRDEQGREVLTFIEGQSGSEGWAKIVSDAGLRKFARLLREYHDASAGYRPAENAEWSYASGGVKAGEIVCHGDFGPWNVVWQADNPVGILDWDMAFPAPTRYDVLYALEYAAPFRDDAACLQWHHSPQVPDRKRRIAVFAEAYGLTDLGDVARDVAGVQRLGVQHVAALAKRGLQPQADWVAQGELNVIEQRAEWTEANAAVFG